MSVAIIDYGSGNLRSAAKAFERAAREANLTLPIDVTADPKKVRDADRVVLPGVGAFGDCKQGLEALPGMIDAIEDAALKSAKPFLGICVGMQLMADTGREHGDHQGFGWIPGEVAPIKPNDESLKIPHMGWNDLTIKKYHAMFDKIKSGAHAYFVHSYGFVCEDSEHVLATVDYGGAITAAIGRDNLIATQFHPEKSQAMGLQFITNFLKWKP
jgi:glutamine amidotransferase